MFKNKIFNRTLSYLLFEILYVYMLILSQFYFQKEMCEKKIR